MSTDARQKRPSEVIQQGVDFTSRLLTSETFAVGTADITVKNALTGADATSTILVTGSKAKSGNVLSGRFQAGSHKDIYEITYKTGATNFLNAYEKTVNLEITNVPDSDNMLANRDEVKRRLGIAESDTSDDLLLDELILMASKYIRARTAREFALQEYVERIYLRPPIITQEVLQLSEWPVQQVSKILLSNYNDTTQTTITDQTSYSWDWNREGELFFKDGTLFYAFPDYNEITYKAGYGKIPDDLRECCKELSVWMYQLGQNAGIESEKIGDYAYSKRTLRDLPSGMSGDMPVELVEAIIHRYMRRDFIYMP